MIVLLSYDEDILSVGYQFAPEVHAMQYVGHAYYEIWAWMCVFRITYNERNYCRLTLKDRVRRRRLEPIYLTVYYCYEGTRPRLLRSSCE